LGTFEKSLGNAALKIFKGFVIEKDIDPAEIDHRKLKNILIVVRHQMGDMLCSVPMLHSIRSFYPGAVITLVTKGSTRFNEIFDTENSPVDEVLLFEHGFENFINLTKILRDKVIDLAIIPSSVDFSATNHLFAHYSNAAYRVGVRSKDFEPNKIAYVLNIKNDFLWESKKVHQIERNLDVVRQIGISPAERNIRLSVAAKGEEFAERFVRENFPEAGRPIIGLHPGAGKEQNIWPTEKFAELAGLLNSIISPYFLITEGAADKQQVDELSVLLQAKYGISAVRLRDSLRNCMAVINRAKLFISNDTGIMHLASGLNIPTIALFGPTKAEEWGPIGKKMVSIQSADGRMDSLEVSKVYETCKAILGV
jgi:ADP-heptose:LPS heptosyltransferase